ncbi:MAG: hypothetical protein ACLUFV_09315 [Acutalibacteraceae bacterium]
MDFRFRVPHSFARLPLGRQRNSGRISEQRSKQTAKALGSKRQLGGRRDPRQTEKTYNTLPKHVVRPGTTAFGLQIAADVEEIDENGSSGGVQSAFAARTRPKPPSRQRCGSFADGRIVDTAPLSDQAAVKARRVLRISAAYAPHF